MTPDDPGRPALTLEEIYRLHGPLVERWAGRLGGPHIDVEDVVQDVFIKLDGLLPTFRGEARLSTWLYRITENVTREHRRRARWRRWLGGTSEEVGGHLPSPQPTAIQALTQREAAAELYRILDRLPEKYRTVLIHHELDGLSGQEIADLTGLKLATVWVQLHRARDQFLTRLRKLRPELAVPHLDRAAGGLALHAGGRAR